MKILIAEDDPVIVDMYRRALAKLGDCEILVTGDPIEALHLVKQNQDITAIVVDGCLGGDELNGDFLAFEIRQLGFKCPMFAASGSHENNRVLQEAGCSGTLSTEMGGLDQKRFYGRRLLDKLATL